MGAEAGCDCEFASSIDARRVEKCEKCRERAASSGIDLEYAGKIAAILAWSRLNADRVTGPSCGGLREKIPE